MAVWDVVDLGRCAHDMLATISHWPGPDEKMETSAFTKQCGGLVATALAAAARLGARSAMISKTGDDDAGAFVRRALEDGGVDVTHLAVERDATTLSSLVLVAPTYGTRARSFGIRAPQRLWNRRTYPASFCHRRASCT